MIAGLHYQISGGGVYQHLGNLAVIKKETYLKQVYIIETFVSPP